MALPIGAPTVTPLPDERHDTLLLDLVRKIDADADRWQSRLAVTISQAAVLSDLRETQIRYYEELGALQPITSTGGPGGSRLYTNADLRRLRALARLTQQQYRPAEAAEFVKQHAALIEQGSQQPVADLLKAERAAVADGFFLVRLISQVIDAVQAELDHRLAAVDTASPGGSLQIIGALFPGHSLFETPAPTESVVQQVGTALCIEPTNVLVALLQPHEGTDAAEPPHDERTEEDTIPPAIRDTTGRDDQTLLYFSRKPRQILELGGSYFVAYIPSQQPDQTILLALSAPAPSLIGSLLTWPCTEEYRAVLLDRLLGLVGAIFQGFAYDLPQHTYRYRSDGFPLALTQQSYAYLLNLIRNVIFPDDKTSMAVLLIPNGLDEPTFLSILSHSGYNNTLVTRARVDLSAGGQGLSGRAYCLREPFVSLHVRHDRRVYFGPEEDSEAAIAIPLAATWGISPFGVLYLASKQPRQPLETPIESAVIYTALLLGNLLSELLGRWWLTRVRKAQDARLHRDMGQTIHWIDGLDAHGPALQRGLVMLQELWIKLAKPKRTPIGSLSLIVLDIAHYRTTVQIHSNDPIPVHAQQHIDCAITAVFGGALKQWYWFANDHALLILEDCERAKADTYAQRIRERVEAQPLMLPGSEQQGIELAVRTAVRTMSYQSFLDLGYSGDDQDGGKRTTDQLFAHLNEIIEHLRYKAGIVEQQETKGVSLPIKRRIVRHTEVWSR